MSPGALEIRMAFHIMRICLLSKIFNETALALLHSFYMEMSPSFKNVMGDF